MTFQTKFNLGDRLFVNRPKGQFWPEHKEVITVGQVKVITLVVSGRILTEYRAVTMKQNRAEYGTWFAEGWCRADTSKEKL